MRGRREFLAADRSYRVIVARPKQFSEGPSQVADRY